MTTTRFKKKKKKQAVACAYGDEAVVELQVEEAGDHPIVPDEAGLDGVPNDGLHAGVAALAGVVVVGQLTAAARGGSQHDDSDGGEQRGGAGRLHLVRSRPIEEVGYILCR